ncbi:MAG: enoyl-CoA hydratase-related protein [Alphaproteobacteria bacterium]
MSGDPVILSAIDPRGVATVTLNRPAVHNAYNGELIDALGRALEALAAEPHLRVLVLKANGRNFSAGADLGWLRRAADFTPDENLDFSLRTTRAVKALAEFPVPTLAAVHGACFGGGVGLVAACDIALASAEASFALTEVRVGVLPAPIAPALDAAIGTRQVRRYALSAERFDAEEARRIGLVHEVVPQGSLEARTEAIVASLLLGGPRALVETKALIFSVAALALDDGQVASLAEWAARIRASDEAREGLGAFLAKRAPAWASGGAP